MCLCLLRVSQFNPLSKSRTGEQGCRTAPPVTCTLLFRLFWSVSLDLPLIKPQEFGGWKRQNAAFCRCCREFLCPDSRLMPAHNCGHTSSSKSGVTHTTTVTSPWKQISRGRQGPRQHKIWFPLSIGWCLLTWGWITKWENNVDGAVKACRASIVTYHVLLSLSGLHAVWAGPRHVTSNVCTQISPVVPWQTSQASFRLSISLEFCLTAVVYERQGSWFTALMIIHRCHTANKDTTDSLCVSTSDSWCTISRGCAREPWVVRYDWQALEWSGKSWRALWLSVAVGKSAEGPWQLGFKVLFWDFPSFHHFWEC